MSELPQVEIQTRPDPLIGQQVYGINLQAPASLTSTIWVEEWQEAAQAAISTEALFFTPLRSLHVTIVPIIWVRGAYPRDPQIIWQTASLRAVTAIAAIAKSTSPFKLRAKGLRVTEDAIILECETPAELKGLRKHLELSFAQADLDCRVPQITHFTLARFTRAVPVTTIHPAVLNFDPSRFECAVDHIALSHELVYPSLQARMIQKFDLADNHPVTEGITK